MNYLKAALACTICCLIGGSIGALAAISGNAEDDIQTSAAPTNKLSREIVIAAINQWRDDPEHPANIARVGIDKQGPVSEFSVKLADTDWIDPRRWISEESIATAIAVPVEIKYGTLNKEWLFIIDKGKVIGAHDRFKRNR